MNDSPENRVREAPQTFQAAGHGAHLGLLATAATYRAKVFKSGNSLALRLPKALGLEAGMEMAISVERDGRYALKRVEPPRRTIDISGFAGKMPGFMPAPREDFDERPSAIARRKALSAG